MQSCQASAVCLLAYFSHPLSQTRAVFMDKCCAFLHGVATFPRKKEPALRGGAWHFGLCRRGVRTCFSFAPARPGRYRDYAGHASRAMGVSFGRRALCCVGPSSACSRSPVTALLPRTSPSKLPSLRTSAHDSSQHSLASTLHRSRRELLPDAA